MRGSSAGAIARYERWLPLINDKNKQCGPRATKALMTEGGVIASEAVRHPVAPLHPALRAGLVGIARRRAPLVMRGGR